MVRRCRPLQPGRSWGGRAVRTVPHGSCSGRPVALLHLGSLPRELVRVFPRIVHVPYHLMPVPRPVEVLARPQGRAG
eukprot:scaffold3605_cov430-Prasinococcus_capsulatus_cf.AAC.1